MEQTDELKNENPQFVKDFIITVLDLFSNHGWYMLVVFSGLVYIYWKSYATIQNYLKRKSDDEYAAKYHKNPDLLSTRVIAMEQARLKMIEKHNKDIDQYKIKVEERQRKKQEELKKKYSNLLGGVGYKLNDK